MAKRSTCPSRSGMTANSGRAKRSRNAWWPTRVGSKGWRSRMWGSNQGWKWSAKASALAGASQPWAKARTQAWAASVPGLAGVIELIAFSVPGTGRWTWRERGRGLVGRGRGPRAGDGPAGQRRSAQQDEDGGCDEPAEGGGGQGLGWGVVAQSNPRPGHQRDGRKRQGERGAEGEGEDGHRAGGGGGVDRQLPPQGHNQRGRQAGEYRDHQRHQRLGGRPGSGAAPARPGPRRWRPGTGPGAAGGLAGDGRSIAGGGPRR